MKRRILICVLTAIIGCMLMSACGEKSTEHLSSNETSVADTQNSNENNLTDISDISNISEDNNSSDISAALTESVTITKPDKEITLDDILGSWNLNNHKYERIDFKEDTYGVVSGILFKTTGYYMRYEIKDGDIYIYEYEVNGTEEEAKAYYSEEFDHSDREPEIIMKYPKLEDDNNLLVWYEENEDGIISEFSAVRLDENGNPLSVGLKPEIKTDFDDSTIWKTYDQTGYSGRKSVLFQVPKDTKTDDGWIFYRNLDSIRSIYYITYDQYETVANLDEAAAFVYKYYILNAAKDDIKYKDDSELSELATKFKKEKKTINGMEMLYCTQSYESSYKTEEAKDYPDTFVELYAFVVDGHPCCVAAHNAYSKYRLDTDWNTELQQDTSKRLEYMASYIKIND